MGMSASQARYLGLTARKNNNEYQAQQIAEQKTMLAMQMDAVATNYTKKVSNRDLFFVQLDASTNTYKEKKLSYDVITSTNPFSGLSMRIVDANGKVIVPNDQTATFDKMQQSAADTYVKALNNRYYAKTTVDTNGATTENVINGQSYIDTYLSGANNNPIYDKKGNAININEFKEKVKLMDAPSFHEFWDTNNYTSADLNKTKPDIQDKLFTQDDADAQAKYESEIARINDLRNIQYKPDSNCLDPEYLENKLRTGEWCLEKHNPNPSDGNDEWVNASWQSESLIKDVLDKSDDPQAEAEYTEQSQSLQKQDKILDLSMKKLDTEHSAIQTEMDSVKKVIDKNIESSFKTFG